MIEIKSDKELTIEFRNLIAGRLIERKANILYWEEIKKECKDNSPEMVESIKNIELNQKLIEKDIIFLITIDRMLGGIK